jgi:hypothetical protein
MALQSTIPGKQARRSSVETKLFRHMQQVFELIKNLQNRQDGAILMKLFLYIQTIAQYEFASQSLFTPYHL